MKEPCNFYSKSSHFFNKIVLRHVTMAGIPWVMNTIISHYNVYIQNMVMLQWFWTFVLVFYRLYHGSLIVFLECLVYIVE